MSVLVVLGTSLVASLLVPIGMAFLSPSTARRAAFVAWSVLLPTLVISCGLLASQGERGFLSLSQAVEYWLAFYDFGLWTPALVPRKYFMPKENQNT